MEPITERELAEWSADPRGMGFYVGSHVSAGRGYGPLIPHFEK